MEPEELAERARRVRRQDFRLAMRLLISGSEAESIQNRADWKPIADLARDIHRIEVDEPDEPGIVNV